MAERRVSFVDVRDLLVGGVEDGPASTAWAVGAGLVAVAVGWLVLLVTALQALSARLGAQMESTKSRPAPTSPVL